MPSRAAGSVPVWPTPTSAAPRSPAPTSAAPTSAAPTSAAPPSAPPTWAVTWGRPIPSPVEPSDSVSTRTLRIGCEFVHQSRWDVPSVFQVEPLTDQDAELVDSSWSFEPEVESRAYTDLYGNPCRRLTISAGRSVIRYDANMIVPDAVEEA